MNAYLSEKLKVISFIAMILVILLHSYNLIVRLKTGTVVLDRGYNFFIQEFISQGITRIAVPLFFAISGYLFFLNLSGTWSEFKEKYRKRIKTLLLPYLFWSLWSLLVCLFFQLLPVKIFFTNNLVLNFSSEKLLFTIFIHPIAYQLWFIRDLMVLVILSPIIFWLIKKLKYPLLLLFLGLWLLNTNLLILSNEAVLFFVFGAYLALQNSNLLFKKLTKKQVNISAVIWMAVLAAKIILLYFNTQQNFLVTILHKSAIAVGIVSLWGIYDVMLQDKKQALLKFAAFSFFLYAFHEPVLMIIKTIFFYLMAKSALNSLLIYILAPAITIVLGIFVAHQLKKRMPEFYGLITGGR